MGVRYNKYFPICKAVDCNGRSGKHCPSDRPRKKNGDYKKCGAWAVELFDESKRWKRIAFPDVRSKRDAEKRLALLIGDRERDNLRLPKRGRKIPTLGECCTQFLEDAKNGRENTYLCKKRVVKTLTKYLGNYKLDRLTTFHIKKFRTDRTKFDSVKNSTINTDIDILRSILNRSVEEGILEINPCGKVKKLKVSQEQDRILTGEEIGHIQDSLKGTKDGLMILVALLGGLRLGEVLSLKWSNVDFVREELTFVQSKTGKWLTTSIADCLLKELEEYKGNSTNERLFDSGEVNTKLVIKYSSHFSRLFKKLGIERFTFHNLRHCFATYQSNCGSDAFITKELLGHASVNQTALYTHKGMLAKRNAIKEMEKHIMGKVAECKITDINSICGTT